MHKLSEIGELRTGFQLRSAVKHREGAANPIIQLGDVRDEGIDMKRVARMDLARAREKDFVSAGDIVLRSRGASYRAALVPDCLPGTVAAAPLNVLRLDWPEVLPEYLVWFLNRPATQALLATQARGTYIPTVGVETFAQLEITVPPLPVQKQILELDSLLRQERELTDRLLEKRERLTQALQERLLKNQGDGKQRP